MEWRLYQRARSPFWQLHVQMDDDNVVRKSTGTADKAAAERFAEQFIQELKIKTKFGINEKRTPLVRDIYTQMTDASLAVRNRYISGWRTYLAPVFGHKPLNAVKSADIRLFFDTTDASPATQNGLAVIIRQIYKFALDRDIITLAEVPRVPRMTYVSKSRLAFEDEEVIAMLERLETYHKDNKPLKVLQREGRYLLKFYVAFLYYTACRPGKELDCLRWRDLERCRRGNYPYYRLHIRPETTKVRRSREIVCDTNLNKYIAELRRYHEEKKIYHPDTPLFANSRGNVPAFTREIFPRLLNHMNMRMGRDGRNRTLYSIRHQTITKHVRAGVPLHVIAKQAGNSADIIAKVYDKSVPLDYIDHFIGVSKNG